LEYSICCADIDGTLADIDDIRKRLASLDFLLADCYSILRSYKERLDGGTEQGLDDKTV